MTTREPSPSYWVQIGAFTSLASAMRLIASLQEAGTVASDNWAVIMEPASAGVALARVRVGPFPDRSAASARAHSLEARGYKAFIAEERESVR
jgi:cell division septation protein DedD